MAKRRSSTARDLIDIVAAFPWWVGVGLAVGSYLLFSALAAQPMATGGRPNLVAIFAGALRIAAPLLFLVGAVASAMARSRRKQIYGAATSGDARSAVASMTWREFELLLSEVYRRQGYAVAELGGSGPDGGVDLVLRKDGRKTLVQCKHWKAYSVGAPVVRELLGVMTDRGADAGQVVTSGQFTEQAREFAASHSIALIDGRQLEAMLAKVQARGQAEGRAAGLPLVDRVEGSAGSAPPPACPKCNSSMVKRTARRGPNAGGTFWGCSSYPKCSGTRPID